jgi:hypothetical protein
MLALALFAIGRLFSTKHRTTPSAHSQASPKHLFNFVVLKFPEGLWTRQELLLIAGAACMLNETSTGLLDFAAYADKLVHATFEPSPQRRNQMMIRCQGTKADVLFHTIILQL